MKTIQRILLNLITTQKNQCFFDQILKFRHFFFTIRNIIEIHRHLFDQRVRQFFQIEYLHSNIVNRHRQRRH